jgi:hypothetical protein
VVKYAPEAHPWDKQCHGQDQAQARLSDAIRQNGLVFNPDRLAHRSTQDFIAYAQIVYGIGL